GDLRCDQVVDGEEDMVELLLRDREQDAHRQRDRDMVHAELKRGVFGSGLPRGCVFEGAGHEFQPAIAELNISPRTSTSDRAAFMANESIAGNRSSFAGAVNDRSRETVSYSLTMARSTNATISSGVVTSGPGTRLRPTTRCRAISRSRNVNIAFTRLTRPRLHTRSAVWLAGTGASSKCNSRPGLGCAAR